ncbi:MAG: type III secretion system translocon subunit SctE [Pararobbsia sp.]
MLREPPGYAARDERVEAGAEQAGATKTANGHEPANARVLRSLLQLQALIGETSIEDIERRLEAYRAQQQALRTQSLAASENFRAAALEAEQATVHAAETQAAVAALEPGVTQAGEQATLEQAAIAVAAAAAAERALNEAESAMTAVYAFSTPEVDFTASNRQTNASRLTEITAQLQALIGKSSTDALQAQSEFLAEMARVRREAALREAAEVERQLQKQARLNKIFGWLGRALGWLLTAVSFAAAIFTGGASLAIAGVMLGLAVTDQVVQATTGVSPLGETFKAVLKPIVEGIASVLAQALEAFGVDAETAKIVARILATILAVVVVIAATVLGAKVASRLLGPLISKLAERIGASLARSMPEALRHAARQASATLGSLGQRIGTRVFGDTANVQAKGVRLAQAANVAHVGVGAMSAGGQAAVGASQLSASDSAADFVRLDHSARVLRQMLDHLLEVYTENLEALRTLITTATETMSGEVETGRFIMQGMHRAL